jgi:hypothetical protein
MHSPCCGGGADESVERVLLDCPSTHALQADERFSQLLWAFGHGCVRTTRGAPEDPHAPPHQYALAQFIRASLQ